MLGPHAEIDLLVVAEQTKRGPLHLLAGGVLGERDLDLVARVVRLDLEEPAVFRPKRILRHQHLAQPLDGELLFRRLLAEPEAVLVHGEDLEEYLAVAHGVVGGGHEAAEDGGATEDEGLPSPPLAEAGKGLAVVGLAFLVALL